MNKVKFAMILNVFDVTFKCQRQMRSAAPNCAVQCSTALQFARVIAVISNLARHAAQYCVSLLSVCECYS